MIRVAVVVAKLLMAWMAMDVLAQIVAVAVALVEAVTMVLVAAALANRAVELLEELVGLHALFVDAQAGGLGAR